MDINLLIVGALNIACFLIGAKVGSGKREAKAHASKISMPTPSKIIKEHRDSKAKELEQRRNAAMLSNIDAYDGTESGQQDIPRR